jgi:hypothetical protein
MLYLDGGFPVLYVYNVTFGDGVFDMLLGRSAVAVEATLP